MPKPTHEPSGASERPPKQDVNENERRADRARDEHDDGALKETVEKAASAYFSACRKLARAISHLKG
ncbi:MAG: hypothetical protein ACOC9W_04380 [Persicimonas sp.]